ncbi:MAG: hypothetical protein Ta2D_06020 [Rickettsiales bacterium]|nr:MAG: hypothetical protein Ta2D_06020 [Rickettsiales bacterium]
MINDENVVDKIELKNENNNINETEIKDLLKHEGVKRDLENQNIKNINNLRVIYSYMIFTFICIWSGLIFRILFIKGYDKDFNLNDSSINTLITTTFIQVLGLMYIVLNHIFPKK